MILKTEGIVIRSVRYGDHSLVATIYTREYGLKSFIVPGAFSSRGRGKQVYFQVLSCIDFIFYDKPGRDLQKLTEVQFATIFLSIHVHPIKTAYAYLVSELINKLFPESASNGEAFEFIKNYALILDKSDDHLYHYTIAFLFLLSEHLGIKPLDELSASIISERHILFDINLGLFTQSILPSDPANWIAYQFSTLKNLTDASSIDFPKVMRQEVLALILNYYRIHLVPFTELKSLSMLEEIFR